MPAGRRCPQGRASSSPQGGETKTIILLIRPKHKKTTTLISLSAHRRAELHEYGWSPRFTRWTHSSVLNATLQWKCLLSLHTPKRWKRFFALLLKAASLRRGLIHHPWINRVIFFINLGLSQDLILHHQYYNPLSAGPSHYFARRAALPGDSPWMTNLLL